MQRVIEAARNQSYSAFMQTATPVPLPAVIPPVRPVVAESKTDQSKEIKENKIEKKDRDRKRSRSRERRDRSRERDRRDRRQRDRSRSRSRDRRRRRDRTRSRDRSRSRDRDRRSRDNSRRRSNEKGGSSNSKDSKKIEPWAQNDLNIQQPQQIVTPNILAANFASNIEEFRRNFQTINTPLAGNGFQSNIPNRLRESWPQASVPSFKHQNDFAQRSSAESFQIDQRNSSTNKTESERGNRKNMYSKNNSNSFDDTRNQFDPRISPNCCVKIEPFYGAYGDLRRFFHGCFISSRGIKFINDKTGTRTGIVYVQFGNPQSKVEALARNNENLNGVNICITHIDDKEFENSLDRFVPRMDDEEEYRQSKMYPNKSKLFNKSEKVEVPKIFSCLTVEDLPTYVKEQDILKMFSHYPLTSILLLSRGRGGHIAYVKFSNSDDAKKAESERTIHVIEGKPVTVRACKDEDFEKINAEHELKIAPPSNKKKLDTDCLSIEGLPLKTNDRDIADFFSDIGVIPTKIHLMNNNFGFTGQAYCEFETLEEAEKASAKNSCVLGTQLITVAPIKRVEMNKILGVKSTSEVIVDNTSDQGINNSEETISKGLLPTQNIPHRPDNDIIEIIDGNIPNPIQFSNHQQRPNFHPRNNFDGISRGRGGFMGRGGRGSRFGPPGLRKNIPDDGVAPGCTVFMDNIPYKAGTNEILDFFDGYNITNNVSRRFNPNNTPSAEAKVVFHTAEDAFIAVRDKHMSTIWDRPIYLRQV
ncbi:hypothetical protein WA026_020173 [Henosepilachna vigintioctopunctata]|uniref:RRM domain-containing protein n=1 Tax=Henosepilachna vigintioctopunctata TaxID=420089 RepID=A0AAW1UBH2_9CUCU